MHQTDTSARLIYNPQYPSLDATASFLHIYHFRSALHHSTSLAIFIIRINLAYNIYQSRRITLYYTTHDSSSRSFSSMLFISIITFFKRLNLLCCLVSGAEILSSDALRARIAQFVILFPHMRTVMASIIRRLQIENYDTHLLRTTSVQHTTCQEDVRG